MTLGEFTHLSPLPSLVSAVRQALRGLSLSLGPSLDFHRWVVSGTQPRVRSHIQCRHRSRNRASSGSLLCRTPIVRLANLATENLCSASSKSWLTPTPISPKAPLASVLCSQSTSLFVTPNHSQRCRTRSHNRDRCLLCCSAARGNCITLGTALNRRSAPTAVAA